MRLSATQFDLRGKRVFLRADFNVPLSGDQIADDARIRTVIPTRIISGQPRAEV